MLSAGEVAARLAVSKATVYRLVATNDLPAFRLGGPGHALRVEEAELEDWLRSRDTRPKPQPRRSDLNTSADFLTPKEQTP